MPRFEQVNSKVVRAPLSPGAHLFSRRGAMLGYTGDVRFSPASGAGGPGGGMGGMAGMAGMLGRVVSGENVRMMVAEGSGTVLYGFRGAHVTVLELDGSAPLTVEADRLLVHDGTLTPSIVMLGGQGGLRGAVRGAVTGQGLATTVLQGAGSVALLSHGGTFELPVTPSTPVVVDPQAYVAHTGTVSVDLSMAGGWRSGEALQLRCTGHGSVHIQASEQKL